MALENSVVSRRTALQVLGLLGISGPAAAAVVAQVREGSRVTPEVLRVARELLDGDVGDDRLQVIAPALQRNLDQFQMVRELEIDDLVEPAPILVAGWR